MNQLREELEVDSAELAPVAARDAQARGQIEMNGYRLDAIPQEMEILRTIHPQNLEALHARTEDTIARCAVVIGHYEPDDPAVVDLLVELNAIHASSPRVNIYNLTSASESNRRSTEEWILTKAGRVLVPLEKFLAAKK